MSSEPVHLADPTQPGPGERRPFPVASLLDHAAEVAPRLLGALLVRVEGDGSETIARLVEVEAYRQDDPASHSYRGRTPRTEAMFGAPGTSYVYFTYGMHWCCNVSVEEDGVGAAVLLRAGAPMRGLDRMRERRGPGPAERDLLRGPARLTRALGIDRDLDGVPMLDAPSQLRLEVDGYALPADSISTTPRTGVTVAADVPWRFAITGSRWVLPHKRHPRAPAPGG